MLGPAYERLTIPLGTDPDGEGAIEATLIRHRGERTTPATASVLYVHGRSDYFFQKHVAEHFDARGHAFYALDLRKCGRSTLPGQSPHYVSNLAYYDAELNEALRIIRNETPGVPTLVVAHSTGGLTTALWLDRRRRLGLDDGVAGLILNSPFFDLQGPAYMRSVIVNTLINVAGWVRAGLVVPSKIDDRYGASIHVSGRGAWDYDLDWKPLGGFPVQFGWLRAIRRGQYTLQRGLDVGVPTLILRSKLSHFARTTGPEIDIADAVLDVKQIQRWAGCLGDRTTVVPIENARHDVFLSAPTPLAKAFAEVDMWLDWLQAHVDTATR
ncbi:alpha/beta hydrolase [Antrihabitans sp. YC2-6]|uniref:alpha/beta hydrolase n=1 Tax=Antrihabitans sp. YC2-6 TaxID=2799498 RepID=UPI0018F4E826|nr:alpha/beta hydrolase [Antrihabitans sp. YC2-6]MBJ8344933.1 alpha/beta hydrolase [Antrihabitans sp. YC2-6]